MKKKRILHFYLYFLFVNLFLVVFLFEITLTTKSSSKIIWCLEAFKSNEREREREREQFEILSRKAKFLKVKSNKQVRSFFVSSI